MIYIPKICGTCNGANRALKLAYDNANVGDNKKLYIYKEILHNPRVIEELKVNNIECIDDLSILNKEDVVLIRAHGEGIDTYKYLEDKGIKYVDATCPNVSKVHDIIKEKYDDGYSIVIIGKKTHPEVIGDCGWCNNEAFVIENEDDVVTLNNLKKNILIVAQTTINEDYFFNMANIIKEKFSHYNVEVKNTVCLAQKQIQSNSVLNSEKCDYTFIIGGKNSSNTNELYKKCLEVCENSYIFFDDESFLDFIKKEKNLSYDSNICITGGASTPLYQIESYKNLLEFYLKYKDYLSKINLKLDDFNNYMKDSNKIISSAIDKLKASNSGGKCIRGFLTDLAYRMFKSDDDYALELESAYETFETSILVHDDIIDNSDLRRGKDTIHTSYSKEFGEGSIDISKSLALCIGDLGFFYINKYLLDKYRNDPNIISVLDYYNDVVINTIKGEILDVYLPYVEENISNGNVSFEDIYSIYKLKTSWYTIVGPFSLGMILAGKSDEEVLEIQKVLEPLGIAFQIKDDILGVFSDSLTLGKTTNDISEFKQTLLYYYVINSSYKDELLKYYGKKSLSDEDINSVRNIIVSSGSLDKCNKELNNLFNQSIEGIKNMNISDDYKNILFGFVSYLKFRDK